jgi:enoyl-CoA hydratase/carnithine racemase
VQPEDFATVRYAVDGPIARVTMNRPERRNAENIQMITERDAALRLAAADPDVRVIVIGGAGSTFCAGHDLAEWQTDEEMRRIRTDVDRRTAFEWRHYYRTSQFLRELPKPTIAMVQGACVASGFMLVAMCDLVVAADNARFRDPTLGFGRLPGSDAPPVSSATTEVLFHPWSLGLRKAKELLFTGDWLDAADAKECGFVNRVVPLERLEAETMALADRVAAASPDAIALVKQSLRFTEDAMGRASSHEYHFLLHQLRHAGLSADWLRG